MLIIIVLIVVNSKITLRPTNAWLQILTGKMCVVYATHVKLLVSDNSGIL